MCQNVSFRDLCYVLVVVAFSKVFFNHKFSVKYLPTL